MNYVDLLSRPEYSFDWSKIADEIRGKRVLITGAGGSIGSAIARVVCDSNPQWVSFVGHSELPIFNLRRELQGTCPIRSFITDIGSEGMKWYVRNNNPEIVIHAAAYKHVGIMEGQAVAAFQNNTLGTVSLAETCLNMGVKRFVFISTDKAAKPTSNMGASKRLAEAWLLANYSEATIVRFGNVLGSSGSLVEIAKKQIENGEEVLLTDPRMTRFFITPTEAVGLVLTSGLLMAPGLFILNMGEPVLISRLLKRLAECLGLPLVVKTTQAGAGEKLSEDIVNSEEYLIPTGHPEINRIESRLCRFKVAGAIQDVRENIKELKRAALSL